MGRSLYPVQPLGHHRTDTSYKTLMAVVHALQLRRAGQPRALGPLAHVGCERRLQLAHHKLAERQHVYVYVRDARP